MKKIYIPLLFLAFFAILAGLAPRLLNIDAVREKVAARLSVESGWQIDPAQLTFYWLPAPCFSFRDTTVIRKNTTLFLPETIAIPLWRSLLGGKFDLKEIRLVNPVLRIEPLSANGDDPAYINLPKVSITVENGSAIIDGRVFSRNNSYSPLALSSINATVSLSPELVEFRLAGNSAIFEDMKISGAFNPRDFSYLLDYDFNNLQPYNLIPALFGGRLLPVEAAVSLRGRVSGSGLTSFRASMAGDFPCFVSPATADAFLLDCGKAQLNIEKNEKGFRVDIEKLQLKNPRLLLSGSIARFAAGQEEDSSEPVWLIDLAGQDLDVGAIRKGVLTLWGDHPVAQKVCDIVKGGSASRAAYYFKAPLAGFHDIQNMKISVNVDRAEIIPPHTNLFLEEAAGSIEISDGYLSGQGLRARLGGSKGRNCSIFFDLANRKNDFTLELDIDADLAALPAVLNDLVAHDDFRKEVALFTHAGGRASAHLSIGSTLHDLKVQVDVDEIDGSVKYERMGWPVRIRGGGLNVSPGRVSWRGIKGTIGSYLVHGTDGEVAWADDIVIELRSINALVDAAALLRDIGKHAALSERVSKALTTAEGQLVLKTGELTGAIIDPAGWRYKFEVFTSGSRWSSPLLTQAVLAENARLVIANDHIDLSDGRFWFLEQPLLIEGSFTHNLFSDWQGWTTLTGTVRSQLAEWARNKKLVPDDYFPRIPCTLDKLKVEWSRDSTKLSGGIVAGMGGIAAPSVRLDLEYDHDRFKINELTVVSPDEQGRLALEYLKKSPGYLDVSWQGFVNSGTVESLLNENIIRAARIEGDFNFKYTPLKDNNKAFKGWLKARDLEWPFSNEKRDIFFRELQIENQDNARLSLVHAEVEALGDPLAISGQVFLDPESMTFDLDLEAEKMNGQVLEQVRKDFQSFAREIPEESKGRRFIDSQQVKGVLSFEIGLFEAGTYGDIEANTEASSSSQGYILSPASGFLTIDSFSKQYALDLRDSKLCGLDIAGTFNSANSNHKSFLNVYTDSSAPPLFKNVLPCLGLKDSLVDGDMHLDLNFKGVADQWQSGKADLFSDGGYIHRLGFLSKVFRIINLRDLFSSGKLPDFVEKGFAYSKIDINSHVENNTLLVDQAFVDGEGLNLFGQGKINLDGWTTDMTIMVAPLKSIDVVLTNVPLLGKVIGGKDKAVISIPVGLKGDIRNPKVSILPPKAIGEGIINLITNTLMMPFGIFSPLLPDSQQ